MHALFVGSGRPGKKPLFRIGPVPVRVELSFWIMTLVLGLNGGTGAQLAIWAGVVFFSVLVHELGHAFAYVSRGAKAEVVLYSGGGLTWGRRERTFKVAEEIFISVAGPAVGMVVGGLVLLYARHAGPQPEGSLLDFTIRQLVFVNIAWGIFNLLPVLPMDGGRVMESLCCAINAEYGRLWARYASLTFSVLIALAAWFLPTPLQGQIYPPLLLFFFAMQSIQTIPLVDPRRQRKLAEEELPPPAAEKPEVIENLARLHKLLGEGEAERARAVAHQVLSLAFGAGARDQALRALAWISIGYGKADDAIGYLSKTSPAFNDPLSWGTAIAVSGDAARALPHLAQAFQRSPDAQTTATYARCLVAVGRVEEARKLAHAASPVDVTRALGEALFRSRDFAGSAELSAKLFSRGGEGIDAYNLACAEARLGQLDPALEHLRAAVRAGFHDRAHLEVDPDLAPLRERAEWTNILGEIPAAP
jgi:Zn-dependent protease